MASKKGKKKKKPSKSISQRFFWWLTKWCFIFGLWGVFAVVLVVLFYAHDLPDITKLNNDIAAPRVTLLDKNGQKITSFGSIYGDYTAFHELPENLVNAITSTEDRHFFSHIGIDPIAIIRAAYVNYKAGRVVQGGSTITQQLAKNIFLSPDRTLKRKIQELLLAMYLERQFSKEDIFTIYINRIYLGAGNYGIDAAARSYFDKTPSELSLYESAMIAGLIKAPSRYAPSNNPDLAKSRAEQVLINMAANDKLDEVTLLSDKLRAPDLKPKTSTNDTPSSYFTHWVYSQLGDYIGTINSNITVTTTLDSALQKKANDTLKETVARHREKHHVHQGATVTLSPNGEILAMVGGVDFRKSQFNRATQALRQPGSAFKLFVYLSALGHGYSADSPWVDEPITINKWSPKNWNDEYVGEVTQERAFADSINTVAVKIAQEIGIKRVNKTAYNLGITSTIKPNLSSALGSSEVSLLELTSAYAHIANKGKTLWPHGIQKVVRDLDGEVLYERAISEGQRAIAPNLVNEMTDMLRSVILSGTGKQANFGVDAAGKTGTSQDARDAWFIGFTSNYITGVWLGNDDNSPMEKVGGGGLPALIWKDIMRYAHKDKEQHVLPSSSTPSFWKRLWNKPQENH